VVGSPGGETRRSTAETGNLPELTASSRGLVFSGAPKRVGLADPGVLLKDPGVLLKDPGVLLKDPGVLLKDPGVL